MKNVKICLMISAFSFANYLFANEMKTLKKLVEEIDTLHHLDLNSVLYRRMQAAEEAINAINQKVFPKSALLDKAANSLSIHASFLDGFSKKINAKMMNTKDPSLNITPDEILQVAQFPQLIEAEKKELEKTIFFVKARREIKAQLLILYNKFRLLGLALAQANLSLL